MFDNFLFLYHSFRNCFFDCKNTNFWQYPPLLPIICNKKNIKYIISFCLSGRIPPPVITRPSFPRKREPATIDRLLTVRRLSRSLNSASGSTNLSPSMVAQPHQPNTRHGTTNPRRPHTTFHFQPTWFQTGLHSRFKANPRSRAPS